MITDGRYSYRNRNVEAERADPTSWLNWVRNLIALRKSIPELTAGEFHVVDCPNVAVLAYLRTGVSGSILCVNNLSESEQLAELDLSGFEGYVPRAIMVSGLGGQGEFLPVGESAYEVTVEPHGAGWLVLEP